MASFPRGRTLSHGGEPPPSLTPSDPDQSPGFARLTFLDCFRRDLAQCGPDFFAGLRESDPAAYARLVLRFADALSPSADPFAAFTPAELAAMREFVERTVGQTEESPDAASQPEAADAAR